jgi:putative ABC transport system ATP-binding protein
MLLKNIMNPEQNSVLIELGHVTKSYQVASGEFRALKDITLSITSNQLIAITGKSGSGKSTLLNIITGIDRPTEGSVLINGIRVDKLSESELASWRGKNVGVVFQFFQLLPTLTILENVMLPMDFCKTYAKKDRKERALSLLEIVDIKEQADKFPATLSGGQQQRVAIARALANDPPLIVADEPTGNLDSQTATAIFELFAKLASSGKTVVVVTHEREFSSYFENTINIVDGTITRDIPIHA